jgi:hypothetical protein
MVKAQGTLQPQLSESEEDCVVDGYSQEVVYVYQASQAPCLRHAETCQSFPFIHAALKQSHDHPSRNSHFALNSG